MFIVNNWLWKLFLKLFKNKAGYLRFQTCLLMYYSSAYFIFSIKLLLPILISFSNKSSLFFSSSNQQDNIIDTYLLSNELSSSACKPKIALVYPFDYINCALSFLLALTHFYNFIIYCLTKYVQCFFPVFHFSNFMGISLNFH